VNREIEISLVDSAYDGLTLTVLAAVYVMQEPDDFARAAEQRLLMAIDAALTKAERLAITSWGGEVNIRGISAKPRPVQMTPELLALVIQKAREGRGELKFLGHTEETKPETLLVTLTFTSEPFTVH